MYREATTRTDDFGWCFFSGDENQDYINDLSHTGVYALNTIANYDPDIIPYLNTPPRAHSIKFRAQTNIVRSRHETKHL